jgi:hypothetical protein
MSGLPNASSSFIVLCETIAQDQPTRCARGRLRVSAGAEARVKVTDVAITDQECGDCFDSLWRSAFERAPFDAVCTLLRVGGMQDAGWDPFEESAAAFEDYNWHLRAESDELSDKSRWRVGLLMYCQACEMSAVHATLANLMRIHLGQPYHIGALASLGRPDNRRVYKWYPPSARVKWKKIRDMATEAERQDLVRLVDNVYDDTVRNAFSHSDYTIGEASFRWTEGGLPSQIPLEKLNNLITNAFSFFGRFMAVHERWLRILAKMPRYHRWPRFEVLELLKLDGKIDGFRIHFSNGNSAIFRRGPAGVDATNLVLQRDGTINFQVGLLDALEPRYFVEGQEVDFGDQKAVDSF